MNRSRLCIGENICLSRAMNIRSKTIKNPEILFNQQLFVLLSSYVKSDSRSVSRLSKGSPSLTVAKIEVNEAW